MAEDRPPRIRPVARGEMWIYGDAESLARDTAKKIAALARECVADRGRFSWVLAGGGTPARTYEEIAALHGDDGMPWDHTFVFFGDERHVPPDDPESNFRMARDRMLAHVPIPGDQVFRIESERAAEDAADRYETQLHRVLGVPPGQRPRFDLVLLGLAPDGHTASLFSGTDALRDRMRLVRAPWVVKLAGRRITMTPYAINAAARVWFLVTGGSKARTLSEAVLRALAVPLPVHAIEPEDGELRWLVDAAAAVR